MVIAQSLAAKINEKILELLKADNDLKKAIKKWYFGSPTKIEGFPCVISTWLRSPASPGTHRKTLHNLRFVVTVVDKHPDEDVAEKAVMNYGEHVENILKANVTLDGLVDASWVSATGPADPTLILKTRLALPRSQLDYAISGANVELTTRELRA